VQDPLVVGDDQHAKVRPPQRVDAVRDRAQGIDVEPRIRLVKDRELGPEHRQLEDLHPLLLPAREAVVQVAAREILRDLHQLHRLLGLAAEVLELDLLLVPLLALCVDHHPQVLGDGHARDRDRILEGHEQAHPRAVLGIGLGDVLPLEADRALRYLEPRMTHDRVRERRLAGPVGPHQRMRLPLRDVEIEPPEDLLALGGHVQVPDLKIGHWSPCAGGP
jgi:hypothetical protein